MSAYVIVYLESVSDPTKLAEYRRIGVPTLKQFSAKVLVRNGNFAVKEGEAPESVVMLEFSSMAEAESWYHSPVYQEALQHRLAGARCRVVFVEGI